MAAALVLDMGPNFGQCQELNLVEQRLESLVLSDPCSNLRDQVFGNVHRLRFAFNLVGEMLCRMERPAVLTTTRRSATTMLIETE